MVEEVDAPIGVSQIIAFLEPLKSIEDRHYEKYDAKERPKACLVSRLSSKIDAVSFPERVKGP